jgi:indole-3-glycerol phosphate synthase
MLAEIIAHKQTEIAALDAGALRREALAAPAPRDFAAAVTRNGTPPFPRLIAEVKLASPSKGLLAPRLDTRKVAHLYAENGASAISVLTDRRYFLGRLETLRELRFSCHFPLPLLRKDFILSEAQLYESRANGADAVLLIAAALDEARLADLHSLALELGLTPLVEVHNEHEAKMALTLRSLRLVGINNRDLATFHTSLETTERLRPMIPPGIPVISESGITTVKDMERLAQTNVDAVLVGEALVTAPDITAKVRELLGTDRKSHDQDKDLRY